MARRPPDTQETKRLQRVRSEILQRGAYTHRTLWALAGALRYAVRRAGIPSDPYTRPRDAELVSRPVFYILKFNGKSYPWSLVSRLLREAIEADSSKPSQEAADLRAFLWDEKPNLVTFILARPRLEWLARRLEEEYEAPHGANT